MSSSDKLAAVRSELETALTECISAVEAELGSGDADPTNATQLLARISAAQQLTAMIMAKAGELAQAEQGKANGGPETDKALLRLTMGYDALVDSLESLTNDLKTPA